MDSRGDLRYDWKGNPIDLSQHQSKRRRFDNPRRQNHASTLFTSGDKPGEANQGRGRGARKENSSRGKASWERGTKNGQTPNFDKAYFESLLCKVCNKKGHDSLFYCSKFPEFIPRGTNVKSVPKEVCTKCLSVAIPNCDHRTLRGYDTFLCKKYNMNFLLCNQCAHHTIAQDWVKQNFNPQDGKKLLNKFRQNVPNYSATINSLLVTQDQVGHQAHDGHAVQHSHGIADIEETPAGDDTVYVQAVLVNNIQIGKACCPYEVVRVKVGTTYFPVVIIYDTGAQLSLCNYETGPLLIHSKPADKRVTISTVNSTKAKLRRIHTLALGDELQLDAVLIPNLRLNLQSMEVPEKWQHLADEFADQDTFDVHAQILVGADKATVFPYCEMDENGKPIQISSCRLMRSHLTNKLIMFGACEEHEDSGDTTGDALQVNHIRANTKDDEALTNSMSILAISDFDPTSVEKDQD